MDKKKSASEKLPEQKKFYNLNGNGEFSLNLNDSQTRKAVMDKISRFKNVPLTA